MGALGPPHCATGKTGHVLRLQRCRLQAIERVIPDLTVLKHPCKMNHCHTPGGVGGTQRHGANWVTHSHPHAGTKLRRHYQSVATVPRQVVVSNGRGNLLLMLSSEICC